MVLIHDRVDPRVIARLKGLVNIQCHNQEQVGSLLKEHIFFFGIMLTIWVSILHDQNYRH
jgi:hypothetical protein